jgi:hypothetical protein
MLLADTRSLLSHSLTIRPRDSPTGCSGQSLFYQVPILPWPVAEQVEGRSSGADKE